MIIIKTLKPFVEKFPILANFYRYMRDEKALTAEIKLRKKLGFFFNGNTAMEEGVFEPNETLIIEQLLEDFDSFINIGANTGYYVCKALCKGIDTIAFEPNHLNVILLLRNIEANNFHSEFQMFPVALSDKPGILPMYGASTGASLINGWAGQKGSTLVPISTFDNIASSLINKKKCLVVIDVEGAELNCLKGATSLLSSNNDNVFLIEISITEHQPIGIKFNPYFLETFQLMDSYGYSAYTADTKLRKISLSEVKGVSSNHIDTLKTRNFIFAKSGDILSKIKF